MILLGIIGIALGYISYTNFKLNEREKELTHTSSKDIIFRFLDQAEKIIVEKLASKGEVTQAELSRDERLGKVKTFRTVQRLELKGLIRIEPYGKTNKIYLTKDIKEIIQVKK
jgi:uncharacterized membrane protein